MLYSDFNMSDIGVRDLDFSNQEHPAKHIKLDRNASAGTRQKSCNACVRGKRRCDKKAPRCTRCAAKNLDCVYHKVPPGASAAPSESSSAASSVGVEEVPELVPHMDLSGFDIDSYATTETSPESLGHIDLQHSQPHANHLPLDHAFSMDMSFADIVGATSVSDEAMSFPCDLSFDPQILAQHESQLHQQQHISQSHKLTASKPPSTQGASSVSSPSDLQPLVARTQPIRDLALYGREDDDSMCIDPTEIHNPRSRIGITLATIKSFHIQFAQKRQVSFMHPQQWGNRLPKLMMMAFSAASAYANRTPETMGWTMQLLSDTAKDIVREGADARTKEERLARLQALMLLFTMRMFDGDIAARAGAERDMSTMLAWATELLPLIDQAEEAQSAAKSGLSREPAPKSWDWWVFIESARRTRCIVMCVLCMVMVLKEDPPSDRDEMWCRQSFTASRRLWEATSSMEFYKAWRDHPPHLIREFDFKEFWQYGRPDDMDDFTKLIFTAAIGLDTFNQFMQGASPVSVLC